MMGMAAADSNATLDDPGRSAAAEYAIVVCALVALTAPVTAANMTSSASAIFFCGKENLH
jgi:hypothetical protein